MTNRLPYIRYFLLVLTVLLVALRFVHLEADFPKGVTWSGELYTDEGWYSNNAVAQVLTGNWYVDGDFNNATNVPILPVLELMSFEIFGISLSSARIIIAICFLLLLITLYAVVKKYENPQLALLSIFLLSVNYYLFAFSRLAILEIPMTFFVMLSVFLASIVRKRRGYLFTVLASFALVIAILTKLAAVFAIPVVLLVIWRSSKERIRKIIETATLIAILAICYLSYYMVVVRAYPIDFQYYNSNIGSRIVLTPVAMVKGIVTAVRAGNNIDRILYPLFLLCCGIILIVRELRRKPLVWILGAWILLNIFLLAGYGYNPPRYYLPLSVGACMIVAVVLDYFLATHRKSWKTVALVLLIVIYSGFNGYKITRYILMPKYSLITMARSIKSQMESQDCPNPVLLGHFANTIGLAAGMFSINDKSGTKDLDYKIKKYAPTGYVSRGAILPEIESVLDKYYSVEFVQKFDLFDNYATGEPVYFYRLMKR